MKVSEIRASQRGGMSNELLTLWLRAGGGLPADEARELIERAARMEAEHAEEIAELEAEQCREISTERQGAYDQGHKEGEALGRRLAVEAMRAELDNMTAA